MRRGSGALAAGIGASLWLIAAGSAAAMCGDGIADEGETRATCPRDALVEKVEILVKGGTHGNVSPTTGEIVYDLHAGGGVWAMEIMDADGSNRRRLAGGGEVNAGWGAFSPDGSYIVYQKETLPHYGDKDPRVKRLGMTGYGMFQDLWAIAPDGKTDVRLTDLPIKMTEGDGIVAMAQVNPIFSRDGKRLFWTRRVDNSPPGNWGIWDVYTAEIVREGDTIRLESQRSLIHPPDICKGCIYANAMGMFPGDKKLLVIGNFEGQDVHYMDIYVYDLETAQLENLTNTPERWEEGSCISPDGMSVVFMSDVDSKFKNDPKIEWQRQPTTKEWYLLDMESRDVKPLTYFNVPGSPDYEIGKGKRVFTGACSFAPDAKSLVGIVTIDYADPNSPTTRNETNLGRVVFR